MGPMPQYAALVGGHVGNCEESLVRGNDQPSPEGGLVPPFGGYRNSLPLPPRGRGRRPKAGRGRGAALLILLPHLHGGDISNLGDLRAGVDRSKRFWRILQKRFTRGCLPMRLVLLRRSCEDCWITKGRFLWVENRGEK